MCGGCGKRAMGTWSTYNRKGRKSASSSAKSTTSTTKRLTKQAVGADVVAKARAQIASDPSSAKSQKMKQILAKLGK